MKTPLHRICTPGACLITMLLLAVGCDRAPVTGVGDGTELTEGTNPALRLYTGRDSFGVAFDARISAEASAAANDAACDGQTVDVSGSGQATHLGRIEVVQHHCLADGVITGGTFTYTALNGTKAYVSGEYETVDAGLPSQRVRANILETTLRLVGDPKWVWGIGWIRSEFPIGESFNYELDGYVSFGETCPPDRTCGGGDVILE